MPQNTFEKYIGQTRTMNCGLKATIIAYKNNHDIDVQFENGTIKKHRQISDFKKGKINDKPIFRNNNHIGQTRTMKCGLKATIIAYRNNKDIDVRFEDGSIKESTCTKQFNEGSIAHPNDILFDTYKISKVAFVFHNKTYFYVTYTENNSEISEVMCIDDMKNKLPSFAQ